MGEARYTPYLGNDKTIRYVIIVITEEDLGRKKRRLNVVTEKCILTFINHIIVQRSVY